MDIKKSERQLDLESEREREKENLEEKALS